MPTFAGMTNKTWIVRDKPGDDANAIPRFLIRAADVRELVGVDHHALADRDEGGNHDAHAVLEHRRFVGRGRGLSPHHGFRLDHGERHLIGKRDTDGPPLMALDRHFHSVLQEGRAFFEEIGRDLDLVVGVGVHEGEHVAFGVEELIVPLLEPHALDRLGGAESLVELGAVDRVLELDLRVSRSFAGLHVLRLHRYPEPAFVLDHVAGSDFVAVDLHGALGESWAQAFKTCGASAVKRRYSLRRSLRQFAAASSALARTSGVSFDKTISSEKSLTPALRASRCHLAACTGSAFTAT